MREANNRVKLDAEKLVVFEGKKEHLKKEAKSVLEDAIENEFETVLVLGIKNQKIYCTSSAISDVLSFLGMIEALKQHFLENWE